MKTSPIVLAAACFAILCTGCSLTEKYNKNNAAAQSWLASNEKSASRANFEGVYFSPDWGVVLLNQSGGKLSGVIAHYFVKGAVSGKTAYLLLVDDEWVERTAILKRAQGDALVGTVSRSVPYSQKTSKPVRLERIAQ